VRIEDLLLIFLGFAVFTVVPSLQSEGDVWAERGCESEYVVGESITVFFTPTSAVEFELWQYDAAMKKQLLNSGVGTGPLTFVLKMPCQSGCDLCDLCDYGQCTVHVKEPACDCPDQCYEDDLWAMKCENQACVKDVILEENSPQCGYDPCKSKGDTDGDGVPDCEDDCPTERGDAARRGCPTTVNVYLILLGVGGAALLGGAVLKKMKT
jgi:hypothetical protein